MTDTKIIERISDLIDKMDYKTAYIEIQTVEDKFILEKNKRSPIGFKYNINEQRLIK